MYDLNDRILYIIYQTHLCRSLHTYLLYDGVNIRKLVVTSK